MVLVRLKTERWICPSGNRSVMTHTRTSWRASHSKGSISMCLRGGCAMQPDWQLGSSFLRKAAWHRMMTTLVSTTLPHLTIWGRLWQLRLGLRLTRTIQGWLNCLPTMFSKTGRERSLCRPSCSLVYSTALAAHRPRWNVCMEYSRMVESRDIPRSSHRWTSTRTIWRHSCITVRSTWRSWWRMLMS